MSQLSKIFARLFRKVNDTSNESSNSFTMYDNIIEGCQILSFDWVYLYANDAVCKQCNKSKSELIGKNFFALWGNTQNELLINKMKSVMTRRISESFINSFEVEGRKNYFELRIFPTECGIIIYSDDITAKKNSDIIVAEINESYREMFAHNPGPMWIYDAETLKFLDVNLSAQMHYGYSKAEFLEMTIKDVRPEEDIPLLVQDVKNTISDYTRAGVWRHKKKNGAVIYVEVTSHLIVYEAKKARLVLINDITDKLAAQEKVKILTDAVEQNPASIIITDKDGKIEYVNRHFVEFMQYDAEDVIGRFPRIFNIGHLPDNVYEGMWKKIRKGEVWTGEFRNRKKDGTFFWESATVSAIIDDFGAIRNYIITLENITEKKKIFEELALAKEKAEESDKLKTSFLNNISHEIRTPMNAIVGFASLLNDPGLTKDKQKEFTEQIIGSSNQLLSIITDIVSISTLESGNEKVYKREFKLNTLMRKIYDSYSAKAQKQKIEFTLETSLLDDHDAIWSDEAKLTCILNNLLTNAFKFTKSGMVKLGYVLKDSFLEFYVEDTGSGIPKNMYDIIFKRFRQADSTTKRAFGGFGLGLAISKAYIEMLNGKIWFNSTEGYGSTFYFTLPFSQVKKNKRQHLSELITGLDDTRMILIAEDDDSSYELLEQYLADRNYLVIRAKNGIEAVELCKTLQVDAVLMDIKMPQMNGNEAIRKIREFLPFVPIIVETGFTGPEDINEILKTGCDDYILKPIDKESLLSLLDKHLSED